MEAELIEPSLFLDAAPDAMLVVAADGTIEFANIQTARLFGYTREELLGTPLDRLVPDRFRGAHGGHVRQYRASPNTRAAVYPAGARGDDVHSFTAKSESGLELLCHA